MKGTFASGQQKKQEVTLKNATSLQIDEPD